MPISSSSSPGRKNSGTGKRWNPGGDSPQGLKAWSKSNSSPVNKITIRLLSKPGLETTSVSLFLYPQAKKISGLNPEQIPEVLERWLGSPENPGPGWEPLETEQIFVCTHGKHDLCCAKFGQTVYQRLREEASDKKLELDVWEASHLGGHRFAPNLMLFPGGHSHGHLQEDMVPAFLDDWEAGKIHTPSYRGPGRKVYGFFPLPSHRGMQEPCLPAGVRGNAPPEKASGWGQSGVRPGGMLPKHPVRAFCLKPLP